MTSLTEAVDGVEVVRQAEKLNDRAMKKRKIRDFIRLIGWVALTAVKDPVSGNPHPS
jgi:hypothetical protein